MAGYVLDIRQSIDRGEIFPHFQPLVDLRSGTLYGFEVLARWLDADGAFIPPSEFIPLAEENNWINLLTHTLLEQAFAEAVKMPEAPLLAVNVSPTQLHNARLTSDIAWLSERYGYPASKLIVEITESALLDDIEHAQETTAELKEMGCRLALDDFGTGYSSLSSLQALPFDELKIDRRFVASMVEKRESRKIVAAVVGLGHSLGLHTVAEGVETEEQAEMLRRMGCELGQGWLFGPPVGGDKLFALAEVIEGKKTATPPRHFVSSTSCSSVEAMPAHRLAQLQALYNSVPVGLAYLDRNLRYLDLNRRLADMNGRPMEAHLGRTIWEMIPELAPQVEPYIRRALAGESVSRVELRKPLNGPNPGREILLSYEPARDEAGEVVGVCVALMDITPMKVAGCLNDWMHADVKDDGAPGRR